MTIKCFQFSWVYEIKWVLCFTALINSFMYSCLSFILSASPLSMTSKIYFKSFRIFANAPFWVCNILSMNECHSFLKDFYVDCLLLPCSSPLPNLFSKNSKSKIFKINSSHAELYHWLSTKAGINPNSWPWPLQLKKKKKKPSSYLFNLPSYLFYFLSHCMTKWTFFLVLSTVCL